MKLALSHLLLTCTIFNMNFAERLSSGPLRILDSITNITASATDYLTGVVRRQKDLLHQVTDTATDYVSSAVEKQRNLLMNAKRVTTNYIDSAASKGLEFKLRTILEKLRAKMPYGLPEIGVPTLEPLTIKRLDFETHNNEIGDLSGFVSNVTVNRISTFIVDQARLSLIGPTITFNISIPKIYATGHYNVSGNFGRMFPLYGTGPFEATIYGFRLYVNTILGYSRGMYMKTFNLDFSIESIQLDLQNFMEDKEVGRVMNMVFQELIPEALEIVKPEILPQVEEYIASRANETINHLTTGDMINFLTGRIEFRDLAHPILL